MKQYGKFFYNHFYENESMLVINAFNSDLIKIGHINVSIDTDKDGSIKPWVTSALVYEGYRRQGIATQMYDHAESIMGSKIHPAEEQSDDAILFWKSRL